MKSRLEQTGQETEEEKLMKTTVREEAQHCATGKAIREETSSLTTCGSLPFSLLQGLTTLCLEKLNFTIFLSTLPSLLSPITQPWQQSRMQRCDRNVMIKHCLFQCRGVS